MDISIYFKHSERFGGTRPEWPANSIGDSLVSHTKKGFPSLEGSQIALFGVLDDPGHARPLGEHGHDLDVGGDAPLSPRCTTLINAAGLEAPIAAAALEGMPPALSPRRYLSRGNYFSLAMRGPFRRLIYPGPVPGGLGVHLTLDLGGQARFGPDVEWVDALDYTVDPRRADAFYAAVRKYWPQLADGALQPAYSGIRPKLAGPGAPAVRATALAVAHLQRPTAKRRHRSDALQHHHTQLFQLAHRHRGVVLGHATLPSLIMHTNIRVGNDQP